MTDRFGVDLGTTNIQRIDRDAFENCSALTTVTFPQSLGSIASGAFKGCEALTTVRDTGSEAQWQKIYIDNGGLQFAWVRYAYYTDSYSHHLGGSEVFTSTEANTPRCGRRTSPGSISMAMM